MRKFAGLFLGALPIVALAGCRGSWADQTVVQLEPLGETTVKGVAIVSIGKACDDEGRCGYRGSTLDSQITAGTAGASYRIILAKGNCSHPPKDGLELTSGNRDTLADGTKTHVDVPVSPLTGGDYAIVVQTAKHTPVACGIIRRSGPW